MPQPYYICFSFKQLTYLGTDPQVQSDCFRFKAEVFQGTSTPIQITCSLEKPHTQKSWQTPNHVLGTRTLSCRFNCQKTLNSGLPMEKSG